LPTGGEREWRHEWTKAFLLFWVFMIFWLVFCLKWIAPSRFLLEKRSLKIEQPPPQYLSTFL